MWKGAVILHDTRRGRGGVGVFGECFCPCIYTDIGGARDQERRRKLFSKHINGLEMSERAKTKGGIQ